MSRQKFGVIVQHDAKIDVEPDEIRDWFGTLLAGNVQRYVGFSVENFGSLTYGSIITGCLIIEDEKELSSDDIARYIKIAHEKWVVNEVKKR